MHPDKSLRGMLHSRDRISMHMWLVALCTLTVDAKALGTQAHGHDAPVPIYGGIDGTYGVPAGAWSSGGGQESLVNAAAHALHCRRITVQRGGRSAREGHAGGPQHGKMGGQVEAEMGTGCCGRGMAVGGRWRPHRSCRGPIRDAPLDQCPQLVDATPGVHTGLCVRKLGGWCLGQMPYVCANGSLSTLDALHATPDGPKTCLRQLPYVDMCPVTIVTAHTLQDVDGNMPGVGDEALLEYDETMEQQDQEDEAERAARAVDEAATSEAAGDAWFSDQINARGPQARLNTPAPTPTPTSTPTPRWFSPVRTLSRRRSTRGRSSCGR